MGEEGEGKDGITGISFVKLFLAGTNFFSLVSSSILSSWLSPYRRMKHRNEGGRLYGKNFRRKQECILHENTRNTFFFSLSFFLCFKCYIRRIILIKGFLCVKKKCIECEKAHGKGEKKSLSLSLCLTQRIEMWRKKEKEDEWQEVRKQETKSNETKKWITWRKYMNRRMKERRWISLPSSSPFFGSIFSSCHFVISRCVSVFSILLHVAYLACSPTL